MPETPQTEPALNRAGRRAAARRKAGAALSATALATTGAALAVAAAPSPAGAAPQTFTVSSLSDDGSAGTLRWAIGQANTNAGADTIDFQAGLTGTILLTDDLPNITEDVAITGPGADVITVDGDHDWSLFNFVDAGTSTVSGLTLTHGNATGSGYQPGNTPDDSGGGVAVSGTSVNLDRMVITANYAPNDGGGAWCQSGYADEHAFPASLTISNSVVSNNEANEGGGGVYALNCDLSVTSSVISGNTAHDDDGGGIYFIDSYFLGANELLVRDTTLSGNSTDDGGGAINVVARTAATHRIENSTLSGNTARNDGGGLYVNARGYEDRTPAPDATVIVSNSTISGNTASIGGGAFNEGGNLQLVQTTVTLNTVVSVEAASGGGGLPGGGIATNYEIPSGTSARAQEDRGGSERQVGPHRAAGAAPKGTFRTPSTVISGTIVSGNSDGDLGMGTFTIGGSLIGVIDPAATVTDQGGNQLGITDAKLGPLADNGGPTKTHELLTGSPAIDAGPVPVEDFPLNDNDQRGAGYPRVANGRVDVGAFEVQPPPVIEPTFTG